MIKEIDLLKNISVSIDGEIVGGCIKFTSHTESESRGLREYMSTEPYGVTGASSKYVVKLTLLGNYNDYSGKIFTLAFDGGNFSISYGNSTVIADREYGEKGCLYRELTIGCGERRLTYDK